MEFGRGTLVSGGDGTDSLAMRCNLSIADVTTGIGDSFSGGLRCYTYTLFVARR
jgi:hypothetical protein